MSSSSSARSATSAMLWESCRPHPEPALIRELAARCDMEVAKSAAIAHRVESLVWRALESADALGALGDYRKALEALVQVRRMEALVLVPHAAALALDPLTQEGLEPLVVKGPVVAQRFPAIGARPMGDIDLLLPAEFHPRATTALLRAGWEIARPAARDHYETILVHEAVPSLCLELHRAINAPHEPATSLDLRKLWERREPVECYGIAAFGLPIEHEIVFLAAHAGKPYHGFDRLIWIADLAMITLHSVESGRAPDWEHVARIASAGRCATVVAAALAMASRIGTDVPLEQFPLPARGWRTASLARVTDDEWPLACLEEPMFHVRYALVDGRLRRTTVIARSGHGMPVVSRWRTRASIPRAALSRWKALHRAGLRPLSPAPRGAGFYARRARTLSMNAFSTSDGPAGPTTSSQ